MRKSSVSGVKIMTASKSTYTCDKAAECHMTACIHENVAERHRAVMCVGEMWHCELTQLMDFGVIARLQDLSDAGVLELAYSFGLNPKA